MTRTYWALALAAAATCVGGCGKMQMTPVLLGQPKQAQEPTCTILLTVMEGPSHAEQAKYYKEQTEKDTKWKDLYIVSKADHSELYWGKYATQEEAAKSLKRAKAYRTQANINVYAQALVVPLAVQDVGPPEWNLHNASGQYTVVVAVFYDVPEANYYGRKDNAVAYCTQLRQQGEQAYFHHGYAQSVVTVGALPESAVRIVRQGDVIRPQLPEAQIAVVRSRFTYLAVNGYSQKTWQVNPNTGKPEQVTAEPYLVSIPKDQGEATDDALHSPGDAQPR